MVKKDSAPPRARIHVNLVLLRTADEEQMDAVLRRASVKTLLVRRVAPNVALFPRSSLTTLRRRLDDMETPILMDEAPSIQRTLESLS